MAQDTHKRSWFWCLKKNVLYIFFGINKNIDYAAIRTYYLSIRLILLGTNHEKFWTEDLFFLENTEIFYSFLYKLQWRLYHEHSKRSTLLGKKSDEETQKCNYVRIVSVRCQPFYLRKKVTTIVGLSTEVKGLLKIGMSTIVLIKHKICLEEVFSET